LDQPAEQILFMQKTAFLIAATLMCQILLGHRLPLVAGPATVLVVGVIASQGFSRSGVYTSVMFGGLVLAVAAATGLFAHARRLFTPRVVALILLLIAFTLAPTIIRLITDPGGLNGPVLPRVGFAMIMTLLMFFAARYLRGLWKSTLILWSMVAGTCACALLFPGSVQLRKDATHLFASFFTHMTTDLIFEPGVLFSS